MAQSTSTSGNQPLIELKHVDKHYGDLHVLNDINLSVDRGEVVVVIGPSGSGKSTMCRTINRLETIDSGEILIEGEPLPQEGKDLARMRAELGMVFQQFNLFAHMTVLQNVMLGPVDVLGVSKEEARERAMDLLSRVGVAEQADKVPAQLSGGQQQRVAIARALVNSPAVLLADEPSGNLDSHNRDEIHRLFFDLRPDVLVADVMMPRMDGFEMVRRIRQTDKHTPVLFLTARSAINDVVEGFELGANDYLKKPFGMQELIIRIKSLAGKAFNFTEPAPKEATDFEIGNYRFNPVTQRLSYTGTGAAPHADTEMELSHRESEILKRLCENRNQVVNTQNVLLDLWGDDSFFNSRSLHVFITKLRHKLAQDDRIRIVNVRGIGYKLIV